MNFKLTEEQRLIKKTARDFALKELAPGVIERDENKIWPSEAVKIMGNLGFMGMMVSPEWSGGGMDTVSYAIAMEEISRIDASASVIMSVNNSLVCYLLEKYSSDYIKDTYAYQIDCGKLVRFLQQSNPCNYIKSDVKRVVKNGDDIEKLVLDDGSEIVGDLYIDCTGWKQLLGNDDNIDLTDRLFIDTALAGRVKYKSDKEQHPYTDCRALEHGWRWAIPTRSRIGTGYCFNRSITDPDVVADAFVKHWDNRISKDELKLLDWKPQRVKHFWKGNLVSIGLSAGFIEPLESTGLALMIRGIEYLEESMYGCVYNPNYEPEVFNIRMKVAFESAVDYITMHYTYSQRKGEFWDYVRQNIKKPGMQEYMENQNGISV